MTFIQFTFANGTQVKNRIALCPMTNGQSNLDGSLGQLELHWLEQIAQGGFGLMITCASHISKTAQAWRGQLGCYDDCLISGLQRLTTTLKKYHTTNILQIFHGGVRCPSLMTGVQPVSASEYELQIPNFEKPRALSIAEIDAIVEDFANATKRAYFAGFDGIEIHGANGYLITQFISTQTNLRSDLYGGPLENRARFARSILKACRNAVPRSFLVGFRLSPENVLTGLDIDDNLQIAHWLVEDGADFIDLSLLDVFAPSAKYAAHHTMPIVTYFRERLGSDTPIIACGKIRTPMDAHFAIASGATFIGLASTAMGNPDWPLKASDPKYIPMMPPYNKHYLKQIGISDTFIDYVERLPRDLIQKDH